MEIPENVISFIIAVRRRAMGDELYLPSSIKSMQKLAIEISERIENPKNRKKVLQVITGLPITTQKNLTQYYTSVLIDEIINLHTTTLADIERLVENSPDELAWQLCSSDRIETHLPDVQ